ncbi:carbohydrate ABC transporter permease [Pediococcus inopinatus]|uniref:carbohydrate ABC transporter permease n=1 Tax=Pediococcus TaxID=1253 RepID=UPI0007094CB9|nr:carbohydrate ABC transporter permease [Pediococcus inopinatus]AVL00729.1 sugar ABC transporter permease [Pediococcus inopinatus]WPC16957.1 carbohydrate ABC transporter permease [Pediococcus inopinatus]WPC19924.1 carbohydrate ABC transporter permease [Pediococcus inopinatus]WPP09444.1 carbohydrate ABC transporter permease [Pediococcus inopinatus]
MAQRKKHISTVEVRNFGPKTNLFFNIVIGLFALTCLLPLIFIVIISLSSENSLVSNGYQFWPEHWSLAGYEYLATMSGQLLNALGISILVTVFGTLVNATFTSTYAYSISRTSFKYKKFFTIFCLITMLFTPGMVANYIVMTNLLQLKDTIWALILPMAVSPFNIIVMRTFFKRQVNESIIEAARIDGAGELRIFARIVLPLAVPGIATISLFAALGYWNDWFNALLYIQDSHLVPLQYLLMKIQSNIQMLSQNASQSAQYAGGAARIPQEATRMAMVVISILPIALSYPFFQKYFVKGLTIGGVKE